jgi:predicted metal-dependent phosphoesterase TrpH
MISQVDLHVHTDASDGEFSGAEVVRLAARRGLSVLGITDHETTGGIPMALEEAEDSSVEVIPGIELSADVNLGEVHILGYYVDIEVQRFQRTLRHLGRARVERARKMVDKLNHLGCNVDWERVLEGAGEGTVGRPHIAQALVERGYVPSPGEAFAKYIGRFGPAYVERYRLSPVEAVELIRSAGGIPVLAHPRDCLEWTPDLVNAGLQGLEVYYPGYTNEDVSELREVARKYNLIATGGTDFHGPRLNPSVMLGDAPVPASSASALKALRARDLESV